MDTGEDKWTEDKTKDRRGVHRAPAPLDWAQNQTLPLPATHTRYSARSQLQEGDCTQNALQRLSSDLAT